MTSILLLRFGPGDNPRLIKTADSLTKHNYCVTAFCVEKKTSDVRGKPICKVVTTPYYESRVWRYIIFTYKALLYCILHKPTHIHFSNEETILPFFIYKYFSKVIFVLDVYDSLVDRVTTGKLIRIFCYLVTKCSQWQSDLVIVCDNRRFNQLPELIQKKSIIVENSPHSRNKMTSAIDVDTTVVDDNTGVTICLLGNLTRRRGVDTVVDALSKTTGVKIVIAGPLDEYSQKIISNISAITYLGTISIDEVFAVLEKSNASLSFYEPTTVNHIYASPSKVFDAMAVGCYNIVNSEAKISEFITENNLGYSCSYFDSVSLSRIFDHLKNDFPRCTQSRERIINLFKDNFSWEIMENRLIEAYKKLC